MKNTIKYVLQKILGFDNYLFFFSRYCIRKVSRGAYEKEFCHFISLLPDNGLVLDIGANIGITAVSIAVKRPNVEVHAYEPITENFNALIRVIMLYKLKNVAPYNVALGNEPGQLKMIMPVRGKIKMQGLSKIYDPQSNARGKIYSVEVKKLDDQYKNEKITAIKIDVENFEYEVLLGSRQILADSKPIIYCELWNNPKRDLVFDYILSLDYSIFVYDDKIDRLLPLNKPYKTTNTNFIFLNSQCPSF